MNFPPISILNKYHIGDTVLVEPIAEKLSEVFGGNVYIQSRHSEVLKHHPNILTLELEAETFENMRELNLSEAINRTPGERLGVMKDGEEGKLQQMYESAGLSRTAMVKPKLYLSHSEQTRARELRSLFKGRRVGVVLTSRYSVKDWLHTRLLIKVLTYSYNVFVFAEGLGIDERRIIKGLNVYRVSDKGLRDAMVWVSIMDVLAGPDTGLMHIAGALDVPMVVLVWKNFADLYKPYSKCTVLAAGKRGLGSISVRRVKKAVKSILMQEAQAVEPEVLVVRFRGIGDLLMTIPALTTLKKNDGAAKYTYLTSPAGAKLLRGVKAVDNTLPLEYDHATTGLPRLPAEIDLDGYSAVHNLINRVDFTKDAATMKRTDLFGELLDVEVDYTLDWKLHPLYSWRKNARRKLHEAGLNYGASYIAIQITAAGWTRQWPKERWVEFVNLATDAGKSVVILSDKAEDAPEAAVNLTGLLSIEEYVGVIAECGVFVGTDSSGVHLAGSMDVLAIGLFGSVDPKLRIDHYDTVTAMVGKMKCIPCNDSQASSCREDPHCPVCIWNIEPKDILKKVERLLECE